MRSDGVNGSSGAPNASSAVHTRSAFSGEGRTQRSRSPVARRTPCAASAWAPTWGEWGAASPGIYAAGAQPAPGRSASVSLTSGRSSIRIRSGGTLSAPAGLTVRKAGVAPLQWTVDGLRAKPHVGSHVRAPGAGSSAARAPTAPDARCGRGGPARPRTCPCHSRRSRGPERVSRQRRRWPLGDPRPQARIRAGAWGLPPEA